MLIQELSSRASLDLLARARLGRLACSQGGQPYVVPVYVAYADRSLYGFATLGKKIEWMRANPQVCIEVDEVVSPQQWASVIVFGRYEELPDTPEWRSTRAFAHNLLKHAGMWWEPAYVRTVLGGAPRPLVPVFYRIHITHVTGHRASLEAESPPGARRSTLAPAETGWLPRLLGQVLGRRRP